MDTSKVALDDAFPMKPTCFEDAQIKQKEDNDLQGLKADHLCAETNIQDDKQITPQDIKTNEQKLKNRIAQCKSVIESLKSELNEEKARLEREPKIKQGNLNSFVSEISTNYVDYNPVSLFDLQIDEFPYISCTYNTIVDDKLNCDENLLEYEKQLQKYQNTLNMAQNEKKNAIKKQMLIKAYRLKLLEVENQCNIELLRVKQSLQCLEPLKTIASQWKTNKNNICDMNNFEFMPRCPELSANSGSDVNSYNEDVDNKISENLDHVNEKDFVPY